VKFNLTLGRNFYVNNGRAASEACSEMWNLDTSSACAPGLTKTTDNLDLAFKEYFFF
jgi:hypothetical protein